MTDRAELTGRVDTLKQQLSALHESQKSASEAATFAHDSFKVAGDQRQTQLQATQKQTADMLDTVMRRISDAASTIDSIMDFQTQALDGLALQLNTLAMVWR